jgi:hypothetical protein
MPTESYAHWQERERLKRALDQREWQLRDAKKLLQRYMQHIIETKGRSYLDRVGLTARDSKVLSPHDLAEKCVLQLLADGRSQTGTTSTENSRHMPGVTIHLR